MDRHEAAVSKISAKVKEFHANKTPFRIYHGSTNCTRPSTRARDRMVDASALRNVLSVDTQRKVALAEANVPMDELVKATLPLGLVPPVVPEFPGITIGGGFAGTSAESSSFKHGFLDCTVNWIEIVLGDGTVKRVSREEHEDLFLGAAGTFGTLGVLTLLEVRLIECKPYVQLTYHPVYNSCEAVEKTKEVANDTSNDFVDGIMYSSTHGVIITGKMVAECPKSNNIVQFTRRTDPWFYIHAQSRLVKSTPESTQTDVTPLADYLFRYDRGGFWVGRFAFNYFHIPYNRITRSIFNSFMYTRTMYHGLHASGLSWRYIIEDLALPEANAEKFMDFVDRDFGIYPLWLCPLKQCRMGLDHRQLDISSPMLINIGVWGPGPTHIEEYVSKNRSIEAKVRELNGIKWLYAQNFYTEDEFWQIYDKHSYDKLREKYHAGNIPNLFDKVRPDINAAPSKVVEGTTLQKIGGSVSEIWPMRGLYGLWRMMTGSDYLIRKKK